MSGGHVGIRKYRESIDSTFTDAGTSGNNRLANIIVM